MSSTTESEITAATDYGKTALYIRSITNGLGLEQENATTMYEDNIAAIEMANDQKPTGSLGICIYIILIYYSSANQSK